MAGICALLGAGVVLGLRIWNEVTREDKIEDYTFLCENLLEDLPAAGATAIMPSDAEVQVQLRQRKEELVQLSRHCRELAPIARQYLLLFDNAEELVRNAPQGSKIVFGFAEALVGVYTGQREHVGAGGQKALTEAERGWNAYKGLQALFHQKHVLAVELNGLVAQFSGQTTNQPFVVCSFAEHTPGLLELETRDVLSLVNASDRDLHNCVVAVRLSNAKGESYLNLHFAKLWLKGETRVARYSSAAFPKATVDGVTRVEVTVCASEFSTEPIMLMEPFFGWPDPR